MSKKKLFRFSKKVTVLCIVANLIITAVFLALLWRGIVLDGMVVAAMYAPFTIELGYNCMISAVEKKRGQDNGNSEDYR